MSVIFDHVAIAAPHITDGTGVLVGILGGQSGYGGPAGAYRFWHWDYPGGGRIEMIEPMGAPGGFLHRFLERRGPGIHHVTFKVPSLPEICDRGAALGYDIVGYDDSNPHWSEAFLHPKQAMGIVVQMVYSEEGELQGEHPRNEAPPEPERAANPATVVGVRMRTADAARALRQWQGLLQGECRERGDELIFAWPGSGMRIAVSVDPGAPDESVAIELRADRPLPLPAGPHPVIGTRFVQV